MNSKVTTNDAQASDESVRTLQQAYLQKRAKDVEKRSFDLTTIPKDEYIQTGRDIRKMGNVWNPTEVQHWPAIREFLQNIMDHYELLENGRLNPAIRLVRQYKTSTQDDTINIYCGSDLICAISTPSSDELHIQQMYTFPLSLRALDTGVQDMSKRGTNSAGGFGDGFKTAIVALMAEDRGASIQWIFETVSSSSAVISWDFQARTRPAEGTLSESRVLQVHVIQKEASSSNGVSNISKKAKNTTTGTENVMWQVYTVKGIGKAFWRHALPRMQMFWKINPSTILSTTQGWDFIAQSTDHTLAIPDQKGKIQHPHSGIYVRGIWVKAARIPGTIMCFSKFNVNSRDRNYVCDEELLRQVATIFLCTSNMDLLRTLLAPLRGNKASQGCSSSWLLEADHNKFLDRVWRLQKEYILHDVFEIPKNAIFTSSQTTESDFIKWASAFLKEQKHPLEPIERSAHDELFKEVSEDELKETCAHLLKKNSKTKADADTLGVTALLHFISRRYQLNPKLFVSHDVRNVFMYRESIFVPEADLDRKLLLKIVNAAQTYFGTEDSGFLIEAICEVLPKQGKLSKDDIETALKREEELRQEDRGWNATSTQLGIIDDSTNSMGDNIGDNTGDTIADGTNTNTMEHDALSTDSSGTMETKKSEKKKKRRKAITIRSPWLLLFIVAIAIIDFPAMIPMVQNTFIMLQGKIANYQSTPDGFFTLTQDKTSPRTGQEHRQPDFSDYNSTTRHISEKQKKKKISTKDGSPLEKEKEKDGYDPSRQQKSQDDKATLKPENNTQNKRPREDPAKAKMKHHQATSYGTLLGLIEQQSQNTGKSKSSKVTIQGGPFAEEKSDHSFSIPPRQTMAPVNVANDLGGGTLMCVWSDVDAILLGLWDSTKRHKLKELRQKLDQAMSMIKTRIPSLTSALDRVQHGYDSNNIRYGGFCSMNPEPMIVVNLCTYLEKPTTVFDFVVLLIHELAHYVDNNTSGHGPQWLHIQAELTALYMINS